MYVATRLLLRFLTNRPDNLPPVALNAIQLFLIKFVRNELTELRCDNKTRSSCRRYASGTHQKFADTEIPRERCRMGKNRCPVTAVCSTRRAYTQAGQAFQLHYRAWGRTGHQVEGRRDRRRIAEEKEKGPKWRKRKRKEAMFPRHVL